MSTEPERLILIPGQSQFGGPNGKKLLDQIWEANINPLHPADQVPTGPLVNLLQFLSGHEATFIFTPTFDVLRQGESIVKVHFAQKESEKLEMVQVLADVMAFQMQLEELAGYAIPENIIIGGIKPKGAEIKVKGFKEEAATGTVMPESTFIKNRQ